MGKRIIVDNLILNFYKKVFTKQYLTIVNYLKAEDQKTVDIPDFLKPKQEQFIQRCDNFIMQTIKNNSFWMLYSKVLQQM